jgi:mannose-6-phosphate isomerase-like protein (cupin superfamily)
MTTLGTASIGRPSGPRHPSRMTSDLHRLLAQLPGPVDDQYPNGQPFLTALAHGSMRVELFVPAASGLGRDVQQPHAHDELYLVQHGRARLRIANEEHALRAGDVRFVPAGVDHRFEDFSRDFATWVIFYGPHGGEQP